MPLRDVQEAASHADPRTTMRTTGHAPAWTARDLHRRHLRRRGSEVAKQPRFGRQPGGHRRSGWPYPRARRKRSPDVATGSDREPPIWTLCRRSAANALPAHNRIICAFGPDPSPPRAPLVSGRLSVALGDHVADVSAVDGQSGEDDGHDAHG
jgi:hypothetical protein